MTPTVLLVDHQVDRTQAVAAMWLSQGLPWRLSVCASLAEARAALSGGAVDVLVLAHALPDGPALGFSEALDGRPSLIGVPPGQEALAAQALRDGYTDYFILDPALGYLLTLPGQIASVLDKQAVWQARQDSEQALARQNRLLQAISRAQAEFISGSQSQGGFDILLDEFLGLTGSDFGFVTEVQHTSEGAPCLVTRAISNIAWDSASQRMYAQHAQGGMVFTRLDTLFGQVLTQGEAVIANEPAQDPRRGGLPPGHPPLTSFLGLPIHAGGALLAVVGLANRPGGYDAQDVVFLKPLLQTVGQLVQAQRLDEERRVVQDQLRQTSALLAQKTQALELTLESMTQGITNVDTEGRIRVYNRRYLELLDLPEALLARQPKVEEVVRLQTERGDFGEDFQLIESQARAYVAAEYAAHGGHLTMPELYLRRNRAGRVIEVKTRQLPGGGRVRTFTDVTAYFEAQEALRQSEARWRSLTELSSDWFWEQDAEFRMVRIEGRYTEMTGLSVAAILGTRRWDRPALNLSEADWLAHRRQLEAHAPFVDFEIQRQAPSGEILWASVSGVPMFDGLGHFLGYRGVGRNITARKQAEADIERLAFSDELTGLPNRRLLRERLQRELLASQAHGHHGALLFLDLDNFKDLNDTLGHARGDRLLQQVAQRLLACVPESSTVARLGGDEFVLVLAALAAERAQAQLQAEAVAQQVLAALNQAYALEGGEHYSSPSIGITLWSQELLSVDELLKQADLAMYQAKAAGRNTFCFFDPGMQAAVLARSALEADLRQGLVRGELQVHFQPVVDAMGGLLGAEVLVRWYHPRRGWVSPAQFIPLAEQTGLIIPLGRFVLRSACEQLLRWSRDSATAHLSLAVNVSAREFRHPTFVRDVLDTLAHTGAPPSRLKLELTESLLLHDVEDCIARMILLKMRGVGFSLDDFGTGYSSLAYLKRLPLDQLKIDQSFVRDVLTDPNDATIARTIITLAHSLGLAVLAEGVETAEQYEFLRHHGCQQFQGYHFGRPGPVEQFGVGAAPG